MAESPNALSRRGFLKAAATSTAAAAIAGPTTLAAPTSGDSYEYARKIPKERGWDVVVCGGGPSGAAAAICAARLGVRVLLIEGIGSMGGMGSNAYVSNWYSIGDGEKMVVGGLIKELMAKLKASGDAAPNVPKVPYLDPFGFNPEGLKKLFDKLCKESGVEVRFFTRLVDVDADARTGQVKGIITNSVEGYHYIESKTFVDGTGDGILSHLCGVKLRTAGIDTQHIMPPTLCALVDGIDYNRYKGDQQKWLEKALDDGFMAQPDRHLPGIFRSGSDTATMNTSHIFGTDALKTASLSAAMAKGRVLNDNYIDFYRKYVPGCERIRIVSSGTLLGVRESRRIIGEYDLNYADFTARRKFPDQICLYTKAIDIHPYDLTPEQFARYHEEFNETDKPKVGESYGIPYGILVPKGWKNLWVGGRCTSSDIKVNGAIRDQPACSMMGQAAGTAAVHSIKTGQTADQLDTAMLVTTLRDAGAYLPQENLSKTMTRGSASKDIE